MKKLTLLLITVCASLNFYAQNDTIATPYQFETIFERSHTDSTATYFQVIEFYNKLAKEYPEIKITSHGTADAGKPLHLILFDVDKNFDPLTTPKNTVLINNGIHPGEPDGIDASMLFIRDIVESEELKEKYKHVIIGIIPVYNIGGALNRNSWSRANQNGPSEYGFRGNALNYDLNRDFIKNDTKNAEAFAKIFHYMNPDVFIDTHVSNGADYQYTLTHLFTQHNKMGGSIGNFVLNSMQTRIEQNLQEKGHIITPYVNVFNKVPEKGFSQFFDSPRYSTGYTTLFNSLGFMVETHMLKPYRDRVYGTYELLFSTLDFVNTYSYKIKQLRRDAVAEILETGEYPIHFKVDSTLVTPLEFHGYEGHYEKSKVTGQLRLKYHREKPFTKTVNYFNIFKPTKSIKIPNYYVVPKKFKKVIAHLKRNKIAHYPLKDAIAIEVEGYKIASYETKKSPFEGHYLHYNTKVDSSIELQSFDKGDFLVPTNQPGLKYILETLEPEATDSFFNWNFFDVILQQKEHFSPYVFEDKAEEILKTNPEIKAEFDAKKSNDSNFANNWYAQLNFIYLRSEHAEKSYLQYPIYRVFEK